MSPDKAILLVDDEAIILLAMRRELRSELGPSFRYEIATSAEEGLAVIDELATDGVRVVLVISDWLMPGMKGDEFVVRPGEKIATDGVVVSGSSAVDAAMLTGESRPVDRAVGDEVSAGCLNLGAPVVMEVLQLGAQTRYQRIVSLVERALTERPAFILATDRLAGPFLVAVLVLAPSGRGGTVRKSVGGESPLCPQGRVDGASPRTLALVDQPARPRIIPPVPPGPKHRSVPPGDQNQPPLPRESRIGRRRDRSFLISRVPLPTRKNRLYPPPWVHSHSSTPPDSGYASTASKFVVRHLSISGLLLSLFSLGIPPPRSLAEDEAVAHQVHPELVDPVAGRPDSEDEDAWLGLEMAGGPVQAGPGYSPHPPEPFHSLPSLLLAGPALHRFPDPAPPEESLTLLVAEPPVVKAELSRADLDGDAGKGRLGLEPDGAGRAVGRVFRVQNHRPGSQTHDPAVGGKKWLLTERRPVNSSSSLRPILTLTVPTQLISNPPEAGQRRDRLSMSRPSSRRPPCRSS
jgi:CheY-like chemotaxis protein